MFFRQSLNKIILSIASLCCFLIIIFGGTLTNQVFAEETSPTYFVAKKSSDQNKLVENNTAVFLNSGEVLEIDFGKPNNVNDDLLEHGYKDVKDIGDYALSGISKQNMSFEINNRVITEFEPYESEKYLQIDTYKFVSTVGINKTETILQYLHFKIDLSNEDLLETGERLFEPGHYYLKIEYYEHSTKNITSNVPKIFEINFYIFNTKDYFSDESAISENVVYHNVRFSSPTGKTSYKNYFYFNYTNIDSTIENNLTSNTLPTLTFDARKFEVKITKTLAGSRSSCYISKFQDTLVDSTPAPFLDASYDKNKDEITVMFSNLGQYEIDYTYIFEESPNKRVVLKNDLVDRKQNNDVLYVFGYQMFYSGNNETPNNEFKYIENGIAGGTNSADVSYLIPSNNMNKPSADDEKIGEDLDNIIKGKILNENIQPASTNQSAVYTLTNANLLKYYSYFYMLKSTTDENGTTNSFELQEGHFEGNPFTKSGTYLLKTVYQFEDYYNISGIRSSDECFVQFFYFNINNTIPGVSIKEDDPEKEDDTEKILYNKSFTKHPTTVTLAEQSIFNSPITVRVYNKTFGSDDSAYQLYGKITDRNSEKTIHCREINKNYKVVLTFGKNENKNQTILFTIDNQEITGDKVIPVDFDDSITNFVKDTKKEHIVDFFTSDDVVLEWDEKPSGASSTAYYKYIPFKQVDNENFSTFTSMNGIPTNYELDFNKSNYYPPILIKNCKNTTIIKSSQVFTNQGFYIVYISDEAGNYKYKSFCIDRTQISIWQYNEEEEMPKNVKNFNVVSSDTTISWGKYKLIYLGIKSSDCESIKDTEIKNAIKEEIERGEYIKTESSSGKLYFANEISNFYVLVSGTYQELKKMKENEYYQCRFLTKNLEEAEGNYIVAKELTYVFYFIEKGNRCFKDITGGTEPKDFILHNDLRYDIQFSFDAAQGNVMINPYCSSLTDVSKISKDCELLTKAGYSNSIINGPECDLRSNYYHTTGSTYNKEEVSVLTYIFKPNPNTTAPIEVSNITLYYYEFNSAKGYYTLSDTATKIVIYEKGSTNLTELTGDFAGFYAINLNVYKTNSHSYKTKEGKYVLVREYTDNTELTISENDGDNHDYMYRESVFIVDREEIVSTHWDSEINVGGGIFVNVLDDNEGGGTQFGHIGSTKIIFIENDSAKNDSSCILQTNKLPVVVYAPLYKYGQYGQTESKKYDFKFNTDDSLLYFLKVSKDEENGVEYLIRFTTLEGDKKKEHKAKLGSVDFGSKEGKIINNFEKNKEIFINHSFDLNIKITNKDGEVFKTCNGNDISLNYQCSKQLINADTYIVTIEQNSMFGFDNYPNVYKNFKFSFQIIESPPKFLYLDGNDNVFQKIEGISYTNEEQIKVQWTDPNTEFLAKIDMEKIYYYFKTINGTPIDDKVNVRTDDIVTNENTHYFIIKDSPCLKRDDIILYVHMQYEGEIHVENLTYIDRALYLDKHAPETVLDLLMKKSKINNLDYLSLSRIYVDDDNKIVTNSQKYNITATAKDCPLKYYSFAVSKNSVQKLLDTQPRKNGIYYTDGYWYYIDKIGENIDNYHVKKIQNARSDVSGHSTTTVLEPNNYYEIVEIDLAGNISIYTLYLTKDNKDDTIADDTILEFEKEHTKFNTDAEFKYSELPTESQTQNLFAKTYLNITKIDLYKYDWLTFSLNGTCYMKTPHIDNYVINLTDLTPEPELVSLKDLLSFKANKNEIILNKLILRDPTKGSDYTFNLYISNSELKREFSSTGEQITITGAPKLYLVSMKILSYDYDRGSYEPIYECTLGEEYDEFFTNPHILFKEEGNKFIFTKTPTSDKTRYSYEYYDNYGQYYYDYHTPDSYHLEDEDIIVGAKASFTLIDKTENVSNTWYTSNEDIIFNYNANEFTAWIKASYFDFDNNKYKDVEGSGEGNKDIGYEVICGVSNDYYSCSRNLSLNESIFKITLKKKDTGGINKFVITLIDIMEGTNINNEATKQNTQKNIVINSLEPEIKLTDDNNGTDKTSLFEEDEKNSGTLFSGSISINYDTDFNKKFDKSGFPFNMEVKIQLDDKEEQTIPSGKSFSDVGTYKVYTYFSINPQLAPGPTSILIKTQKFKISNVLDSHYSVSIYNLVTKTHDVVESTGNTFVFYDEDTQYKYIIPNHYIVKSGSEIHIDVDENNGFTLKTIKTCDSGIAKTYVYKITNYPPSQTSPSTPLFETFIAVTYIPSTDKILSQLKYSYPNGTSNDLVASPDNQFSRNCVVYAEQNENDSLTISFNAYYGIPENKILPEIYYGENSEIAINPQLVYGEDKKTASFTLTYSGRYEIKFTDQTGKTKGQTGNTQVFTDDTGSSRDYYEIKFIKGVAYKINGELPINYGIYNDSVEITLQNTLSGMFSGPGAPIIVVEKNGVDISKRIKAVDGVYTLNEMGFYTVYFEASVGDSHLRQEKYSFTIMSSNEYRKSFTFAKYADYEITNITRDGEDITESYSSYFKQKKIRTITLDLSDEITGQGEYSITVKTNSMVENQEFTFNFIIKQVGVIPINISLEEGKSTSDNIITSFNVATLYDVIGECKVKVGDTTLIINKNYLDSLSNDNYYKSIEISETGTYFIQVYSISDKLLYSYKVTKVEPLNTVSIVLIVASVVAASALIITISLLRKKMKIK